MRTARAAFSVIVVALTMSASGCGSDSDDGNAGRDDAQAIEARIDRERAEAARLARQDERLKTLERELKEAKRKPRTRTVTAPQPTAASAPNTPAPAVPGSSSDDWPGGTVHTVILGSKGSESEARDLQRQANDAGLQAGVLFSSSYRSLRAGFWVTFSGAFPSSSAAAERRTRARAAGFSQAYVRFVSP
jgi:hypothetical protein